MTCLLRIIVSLPVWNMITHCCIMICQFEVCRALLEVTHEFFALQPEG